MSLAPLIPKQAERAFEAGKAVLQLYKEGKDFVVVRKYLETKVFNFRPGYENASSGGALPQFSRGGSFTREINPDPIRHLGR